MREKLIEWRGEVHSVNEWARDLDIPQSTIRTRLRKGYPLDRVFEKYVQPEPKWYVVYHGEEIVANGYREDVCRQIGWSSRLFTSHLSKSKRGKDTFTIIEVEGEDDY